MESRKNRPLSVKGPGTRMKAGRQAEGEEEAQ
jgi:hypothetical protein